MRLDTGTERGLSAYVRVYVCEEETGAESEGGWMELRAG